MEALHRDEVPQTVLDRAAGEKETGNRFARLPEAEDTQVYFLLRGQTQYEGYGPSHLFAFVMGSLVLRQSVPTLTFMECGLMKAEVRAMGLPLD